MSLHFRSVISFCHLFKQFFKLLFRLPNYVNPQNPKVFALAAVISYDISGLIGEYITEEKLASAHLQFLGMVVNDQYQVIIIF